MHALYLISVWLHVLAATTWLGGMLFLVLVIVPWLRAGARADAVAMLRATGTRFRAVGWACFGLLLATGTFNLWVRGVRLRELADPTWLRAPFGSAVAIKLTIFAMVLGVSAVHDFWLGPRATVEAGADPGSAQALRLRRWASWVGRANVLLALALFFLAVVLVRGWP